MADGVDGGLVRLHLEDGHGMGRMILQRVKCLTGNQRMIQIARAVLRGEAGWGGEEVLSFEC